MARPAKAADVSTFAGAVANRIRTRRKRLGLTVEGAATTAGVPAATWYGWENCHSGVPLSRLPAIAAALGCGPSQLLPAKWSAVGSRQEAVGRE